MNIYSEEELHSLITRFEAQKLPKAEWTHAAHLAVAIWYTMKLEQAQVLPFVREHITLHNISVGTPNTDTEGYHETITRFWLWVAERFTAGEKTRDVTDVCNAFTRSAFGESKYPLRYYTPELLFSVKARHYWVEPDLATMDKLLE